MTDEQMIAVVREAVKQAVHNELGEYKIPKEEHYNDHKFIQWLRDLFGDVKDSAIKSAVGVMVVAFFTVMLSGLYYYFGNK